MKIQYKCLVPIYVFPEMKLLFPKQNYNVLSPSSYTYISVRNLYTSRISLYSAAGKYVDQSREYINCSQTHECENWDWGRAIPRKGIHKWNFLCSVKYAKARLFFLLYLWDGWSLWNVIKIKTLLKLKAMKKKYSE